MKPDNLLNFVCNQATLKHTDGAYRRLRNVDYVELARREERRVSEAIKIRDDCDIDNKMDINSFWRNTQTDKMTNKMLMTQTLSRDTSYMQHLDDEKAKLIREGSQKSLVKNASHIKMSL